MAKEETPFISPVRKALIPLAGLGTRLFPASKAVKKELFPLITPDGRCQCLLQRLLEEAFSAGVEELGLIVRPGDEALFDSLFKPLEKAVYARLDEQARAEEELLVSYGRRVSYIRQESQEGLGHAVYCARQWIGEEPFLLMLSDHIYVSSGKLSCAQQLLQAFAANGGQSVLSLYPVAGEMVRHYGSATGKWLQGQNNCLQIEKFVEKPSLELARTQLRMSALPPDSFLCIYGQYALNAEIFALLEKQICDNERERGEFQLSGALAKLAQQDRLLGYVVEGEHYDTGQPRAYLQSLLGFAHLETVRHTKGGGHEETRRDTKTH
ncbi:MAG: sugar phosphate nucleotidyltransferase [Lentisphaeria bacterium]|nr:sugar phosphate nucleotidyltransferase [Lentisphaeria bacterium]